MAQFVIRKHQPRLWLASACAAALSFWACPASAVIIYGGNNVDAPANNTAPAGFEDAWNRVGTNGNGTGVYLGNAFVLTAAHVSSGLGIDINGTFYDRIINSSSVLKNDDDSDADLRLYRIAVPQGTPLADLDPISIINPSIASNSNSPEGILIGTGVRQTTLQPIPLAPEGGPTGSGFVWDIEATRDTRWAEIEMGTPTSTPDINGRSSEGFTSTFRFNAGPDGIASEHDSGAPLFYDTGSEIVLTGLVNGVTRTAFAKQNDQTFFSDLAYYTDQIVITPGDLNGDGNVDQIDLDRVLSLFGQSVQAGNYKLGDADGDGQVDIDDLEFVLARWGDGPGSPSLADPSFEDAGPGVPEPTSLLLITGGLVALSQRRRRS